MKKAIDLMSLFIENSFSADTPRLLAVGRSASSLKWEGFPPPVRLPAFLALQRLLTPSTLTDREVAD
jgi:hypothetical protein